LQIKFIRANEKGSNLLLTLFEGLTPRIEGQTGLVLKYVWFYSFWYRYPTKNLGGRQLMRQIFKRTRTTSCNVVFDFLLLIPAFKQ